MENYANLPDWSVIPAPTDDGAARYLPGNFLPSVLLKATNGAIVDLAGFTGLTVVYAYPRTGQPGVENPPGWDLIPGARGCTPQSCVFRDHFTELKALGADQVFGLSTQDTAYQREVVERLHLPFPLLSDEGLKLANALNLPTFQGRGNIAAETPHAYPG
jgi:peroxiredoxin